MSALFDSRFAFLRDPGFLLALALAAPAALAFALAQRNGVAIELPANALLFLLVYPVLEEAAFRGLIQGALLRRSGFARAHTRFALTYANLVTAALFALAHLLREPWLWAIATFVPGLIFGWQRERHAGLAAPIVLHCAYNAAIVVGVAVTRG